MPDTRLLLDGTDLEPLLARAKEMRGRVVKVERVRKGRGPFATERFEVSVQAPQVDTSAVFEAVTSAQAGQFGRPTADGAPMPTAVLGGPAASARPVASAGTEPGPEAAPGASGAASADDAPNVASGADGPVGLAALLAAAEEGDGADGATDARIIELPVRHPGAPSAPSDADSSADSAAARAEGPPAAREGDPTTAREEGPSAPRPWSPARLSGEEVVVRRRPRRSTDATRNTAETAETAESALLAEATRPAEAAETAHTAESATAEETTASDGPPSGGTAEVPSTASGAGDPARADGPYPSRVAARRARQAQEARRREADRGPLDAHRTEPRSPEVVASAHQHPASPRPAGDPAGMTQPEETPMSQDTREFADSSTFDDVRALEELRRREGLRRPEEPRPATFPAWDAGESGRAAAQERAAATDAWRGLRELGVPRRLLPRDRGVDDAAALVHLVHRLPAPAPQRLEAGQVLVLLGDMASPDTLDHGLAQARRAASAPVDVVLVGDLSGEDDLSTQGVVLADGDAAYEMRRSRRAAAEQSVLVVAVGPAQSRRERRQAAEVLDELLAGALHTSWVVLDARRRLEQWEDMLDALPVAEPDLVVAHHVADAPRPGELLGLDLPVATLDGMRASRAVWAGLLEDAGARR